MYEQMHWHMQNTLLVNQKASMVSTFYVASDVFVATFQVRLHVQWVELMSSIDSHYVWNKSNQLRIPSSVDVFRYSIVPFFCLSIICSSTSAVY